MTLIASLRCQTRRRRWPRLRRWLRHTLERQRSRRALAELSDEALRDLGLTRAQAERESRRPFWD